MTKPFSYQDFINSIEQYYISYNLLLYSINMANLHLQSDFYTCTLPKDYMMVDFLENINIEEKRVHLHATSIKELIEDHAKKNSINYLQGLHYSVMESAHFLRTRVLNAVYESIKKYLHAQVNGQQELRDLHQYDWFKIVYVLRNAASHGDDITARFPDQNQKFPKYPDEIHWNNIKIQRNQTDRIRYNDREILDLISLIIEFFSTHEYYRYGQ